MSLPQTISPPEQWASSLDVMEESARIKGVVLPIFMVAQQRAVAVQDQEMGDLRALMGYDQAETVPLHLVTDRRANKDPMLDAKRVMQVLPLTMNSIVATSTARRELRDIHAHRSPKLAVALGECGVWQAENTLDNARLIKGWQDLFPNLLLLQRVFLEKPRTPPKKGEPDPWKGFIYDPRLDGSNDINLGVIASRMLVCRITDHGVPIIKEQLNPLTPQYTDGAIAQENTGARNGQDQTLMEIMAASSAMVGTKNTVDGSIRHAVQASSYVKRPHTFIGVDYDGNLCIVEGTGNVTAHPVLRGGGGKRNFMPENIDEAKRLAEEYGIPASVDVDVSHDNSLGDDGVKHAKNQLEGVEQVSLQLEEGEVAITGVQMETNTVEGKQKFKLGEDPSKLKPQISITDECIGPVDTETALHRLSEATIKRQEKNTYTHKVARRT